MPTVIVKTDEPFEKAYRRFIKACEKSGLMADVRKNERYEKPSEARNRKKVAAKRRARRIRMLRNS